MNWDKESLKKLSNEELDKLLDEVDYCDRELLKEHDERVADGRIKLTGPILPEQIEEFIKQRYAEYRKKKAS